MVVVNAAGKEKEGEKITHRVIYPVTEGVASAQTRKKYDYNFKCFTDHFEGITDESLVAKGEREPRVLEGMIIQWIRYLSSERLHKHSTIHHEVAVILHFFDWNDIRLNIMKINRSIPQDEQIKEDRHYTYDEIQRMHDKCDERGKIIILLMASTGMRIGALPGLKVKDLSIPPQRKDLYRVQVYARTRESYYTFTTPECKKAIDEYLYSFREVHGETIEKDSPLIRESFDTTARYAAAKPKPLHESGLETIMYRILKRSEVRSSDVMRSHGLRKFAITQMRQAKVEYNDREYLVGHRHSLGLDLNYDRTEEEKRLDEYSKAILLLTINPTQRLKQENAELRKNQSDYLAELGELKEDFYELKQFVLNIDSQEMKRKLLNGFVKEACFAYQEEGL
jgi:integrase